MTWALTGFTNMNERGVNVTPRQLTCWEGKSLEKNYRIYNVTGCVSKIISSEVTTYDSFDKQKPYISILTIGS